ncbi:MAG: alpha/beta hydrolase [Clostridia bacterium]|nr:alpha/beta hydrolase [Clostridia bacterium]
MQNKKILKTAALTAVGTAAAALASGEVFYELILNARVWDRLTQLLHLADPVTEDIYDRAPECLEGLRWMEEQSPAEVRLLAGGGREYVAHKLCPPDGGSKWVITCHGYCGHGVMQCVYARHFYERGWNVLMPDLPGHGADGARYTTMGREEAAAAVKWAEYVAELHPDAQIALHGQSMGGATVLIATGMKLPRQVFAAIEDCAYTSLEDEYRYELKEKFRLPVKPILPAADLVSRLRTGRGFDGSSPIASVAKSDTPTLFIHGDRDTFVPFYMLDCLYNACAAPKQKLVVPGSYHATNAYLQPELYWNTVFEFLEAHAPDAGHVQP